MISWTRKYAPKSTAQVIGQKAQVLKLRSFIENFKKSKKKSALLYGFTGSGKTSSVYAIASELNCEILEINASDLRNAASIESVIGSASGQLSLFGLSKIILVDEIDGVSGAKDRGGIPALAKLIAKSAFPIVMTANDPWDKKFSALRKSSEMIEYMPLGSSDILLSLKKICQSEGILADDSSLTAIAARSRGDLRAATNDLQIISSGSKSISQADVDSLSDRNRIDSMLNALVKILRSHDFEAAASAFDDLSEQPNEWFLWLDENIPSDYKNPKYLAKAYECL